MTTPEALDRACDLLTASLLALDDVRESVEAGRGIPSGTLAGGMVKTLKGQDLVDMLGAMTGVAIAFITPMAHASGVDPLELIARYRIAAAGGRR